MPRRTTSRLTDAFVRSLKPREKRYDVYDAQLAGFGIRVSPLGTKSWIVLSRNNQRKTRVTLGRYPQMSLNTARQRALVTLNAMAQGEYKRTNSFELFSDALQEWYLRDQSTNKSFAQVEKTIALHVEPYLKNFKIREIEKRDLLKIIDRVGRKAPTQANRVLSFVKRFFTWCVSRDLLDVSPANGIAKFKTEQGRDRVLSPIELERVYQACDQLEYPFGPLYKILLLTGQRLNEVAGMSWTEVDFDNAIWTIPSERAKNKSSHLVHLSKPVLKELNALYEFSSSDLVFTTTGSTPVSGFSKSKRKLDHLSGVTNWRLHDLRRSFATVTTETLGFEPPVVDRILNHVSGSVQGIAAVYQRGEYLKKRKEVLEGWANYLEGLGQYGTLQIVS
jgi:integrase